MASSIPPLEVPFHSIDDPAAPASLRMFIKLRLVGRKMKAGAGLAGMVIAAYVAYLHQGSPQEIFMHGFIGGVAAYLIVWWMWLALTSSVRKDLSRDLATITPETAEERSGE